MYELGLYIFIGPPLKKFGLLSPYPDFLGWVGRKVGKFFFFFFFLGGGVGMGQYACFGVLL